MELKKKGREHYLPVWTKAGAWHFLFQDDSYLILSERSFGVWAEIGKKLEPDKEGMERSQFKSET